MIFITVGNSSHDTLMEAMDKLSERVAEAFICQIGRGKYRPKHARWFRWEPFIPNYCQRARLVVYYGDKETLMSLTEQGIKPIVAEPTMGDMDAVAKLSGEGKIELCKSVRSTVRKVKECVEV